MPDTLYLIDGHALAYRAYFALVNTGSRFQTQNGEPTAATFGFMNVLISLLEKENPQYLAVAFDTGKTFRNDAYSEYKATRAKMPEELGPQIERIRELLDAFNFPRLEIEGYEADDVLGSIAYQAAEQGYGVKIITGDRDLLQLVNDRIIVNLTGGKMNDAKDYFSEDVKDKMGVPPNQIVDLKALIGDTSDNIPGVKGIGPKTAISLLENYASLDGIYAHINDVSGRPKDLLTDQKEMAYLSYDLARIRTDVPISLDIATARTDRIDLKKLSGLFSQLEFTSIPRRLEALINKGIVSLARTDEPV